VDDPRTNPEKPSWSERHIRRALLRGREASRDHVVAALRDPATRYAAAGAAADLGATEAIPDLLRLLRASDPHTRVAAAKALGKLQAVEAAQPLREIAGSDEVGRVRSYAAEALARLADPQSTPLLVELLASSRWRDRMAAAHTLALVGDPTALEAVEAARRRDRWQWRYLVMRGAYVNAAKNLRHRSDRSTTRESRHSRSPLGFWGLFTNCEPRRQVSGAMRADRHSPCPSAI
jgi:HEAT repeat protein